MYICIHLHTYVCLHEIWLQCLPKRGVKSHPKQQCRHLLRCFSPYRLRTPNRDISQKDSFGPVSCQDSAKLLGLAVPRRCERI